MRIKIKKEIILEIIGELEAIIEGIITIELQITLLKRIKIRK